jgi:rare lipoprotein A
MFNCAKKKETEHFARTAQNAYMRLFSIYPSAFSLQPKHLSCPSAFSLQPKHLISYRYLLISAVLATLLSACASHRTRVIDTPETRGLKGWQKPYMVDCERYDPLMSHEGFVQDGLASWYDDEGPTSNGESYDKHALTAAHKTLPLGVYVRVRNKRNGSEVVVRINDRGPFVKERIIDLSLTAAKQLGITDTGTAPVHIEALGYRLADGAGPVPYRPPTSYDAGNFAIQIAAFTNPENAERLASRMRKSYGSAGIQDVTVKGNRFFRVRVGNFSSLEKAEKARGEFERNGFQGCFVVAAE